MKKLSKKIICLSLLLIMASIYLLPFVLLSIIETTICLKYKRFDFDNVYLFRVFIKPLQKSFDFTENSGINIDRTNFVFFVIVFASIVDLSAILYFLFTNLLKF